MRRNAGRAKNPMARSHPQVQSGAASDQRTDGAGVARLTEALGIGPPGLGLSSHAAVSRPTQNRKTRRVLFMRAPYARASVRQVGRRLCLVSRACTSGSGRRAEPPHQASSTSCAMPKPVLAPLPLVTSTTRVASFGASITQGVVFDDGYMPIQRSVTCAASRFSVLRR